MFSRNSCTAWRVISRTNSVFCCWPGSKTSGGKAEGDGRGGGARDHHGRALQGGNWSINSHYARVGDLDPQELDHLDPHGLEDPHDLDHIDPHHLYHLDPHHLR